MLRLMLIRHAKAGPHGAPGDDRARPLTGRGVRDAEKLGQRLAAADLRPDRVLCSPARRTSQTADGLNGAGRPPLSVIQESRIYDASAGTLLELIGATSDDVCFLALVGHNPGLADLAARLLDPPGRAAWAADGGTMPPGSAVVMDAGNGAWKSIEPGRLHLARVFMPDAKTL